MCSDTNRVKLEIITKGSPENPQIFGNSTSLNHPIIKKEWTIIKYFEMNESETHHNNVIYAAK